MKSWPSHLMGAAAGLALAVLLAIAAAGGTYALWNTQVSLPGGAVTAGNASLTIEGPADLDTEQLYPGQTVSDRFTVHNTGTVPLELQVDALTWPSAQASSAQQAFAQSLDVHVWPATGHGCETTPTDPAWSGKLNSPPRDLEVTVDAGAEQSMCLAATLAAEAPDAAQGASIDIQLTVGGAQQ